MNDDKIEVHWWLALLCFLLALNLLIPWSY